MAGGDTANAAGRETSGLKPRTHRQSSQRDQRRKEKHFGPVDWGILAMFGKHLETRHPIIRREGEDTAGLPCVHLHPFTGTPPQAGRQASQRSPSALVPKPVDAVFFVLSKCLK